MIGQDGPSPRAGYDDPDRWLAERRLLFERSWQVVARGSDLLGPGDYVATSIAGLGVVALRQPDATVLGFRNVCLHQGMPMLAAGTGRCAQIRCPYHGWTYGLSGALEAVPAATRPAADALTATGLARIGVAEHGGFVWLNLDPTAEPEGRELLPVQASADGARESRVEPVNWKIAMERGLASADLGGWCWPNLLVLRGPPQALLVLQPRGFNRTELLRLPIAGDAPCEDTDPIAAFRARVARLHGDGVG